MCTYNPGAAAKPNFLTYRYQASFALDACHLPENTGMFMLNLLWEGLSINLVQPAIFLSSNLLVCSCVSFGI